VKIYTFPHGGILFTDPTAPARNDSVLSFLPGISVVPLVQQSGRPSTPVVSAGDKVYEGQLIARGQGVGSVNIHSPVPGKIIANTTWNIAFGVLCNSMVIRMEGPFKLLGKEEKRYPWEELSPFELREIINDYGIVEMDGTGVPVNDIISLFHNDPRPVTLVARLVFDDPWLVSDYVLCRERIADVAEGVIITARASQAARIVLAVSAPEKDLGFELHEKIARLAAQFDGAAPEVVVVGARYPQRNKRELELVLRNYERKERQDLGAMLCMGCSTFAAIRDAVILRKPVMERYVAVGGSAVRSPKVLRARIGTRIAQLFSECGGFSSRPKRTAVGSPLLGRPVFSMDEPLVAANYAVFAVGDEKSGFSKNPRVLDLRTRSRLGESREKPEPVPFKHPYARAKGCIGCGECRAVCPIGLDPEDLYKQLMLNNNFNEKTGALCLECHGCGCCEVVCPSRLPLSRLIINPGRRTG
jgi:electron transport complex protein RnfC